MKKKIFSTLLLVAFALASTSMFVSCKDYDDDINKNAADISALRSELQTRLAECKSNCDAEHAKFLTSGDLAGYAKLSDIPTDHVTLSALQSELANYVKADAIQSALDYVKTLQDKGLTADGLANLGVKVAAIDEALLKLLGNPEIDKAAAAAENLKEQIDALKLYKEALEKEKIDPDKLVELLKKIDGFNTEIQSFPADNLTADEVTKLKEIVAKASDEVQPVAPDLNIIQYLIDKTLASVVLKPDFYNAGLASIEVPALYYQPVIEVKDPNCKEEAYYYIDKNGKSLYQKGKTDWRFDDGANAPVATAPAIKWDPATMSGYDYTGEPVEGTMLPLYRDFVSKYSALKTAKLVPYAYATYHVNPTSVNLDAYKVSFYTNTAVVVDEIESRNTGYKKSMANNFATPKYENGADYAKNGLLKGGLLTVPFKLNNWENYVEDIIYYADGIAIMDGMKSKLGAVKDSINFVALQMQKVAGKQKAEDADEAAVVTSDYAAVVPALLHINALADNKPENPILDCKSLEKTFDETGHMYKYAKQAIDNDFTHSIPYNKTLDILPFVETHFTYIGTKARWADYDQKMDAETFKKLGLRYEFSVVDYEDGHHATGESRHITIDAQKNAGADFGYDKVILTPRSVAYDKEGKSYSTIKDKVATREAIDREPLIKVEIKDEADQVLEVGYIKILITDNYEALQKEIPIDDDYVMNCTFKGGIKWSQVEESILSELAGGEGYTKKQFEDEYEIDLKDAKFAQRFVKKDGKFVIDEDPLGDVDYTKITIDDPKDKQTNVINWDLGKDYARIVKGITGKDNVDDAREALLENQGDGIAPNKLETTVRFVKKGVDAKYKDMTAIYVTITIAAPQVHFAYGEVTKKDLSHWYALNSYKHGSDAADVKYPTRAIDILENVPTPAENNKVNLENDLTGGTRTNEFERPLYENFLNGIVNIEMGKTKVKWNGVEQERGKFFDKYVYMKDGKNINVDFEFTLPVKDKNAEFSHVKGTWTVKGISGRTYTLSLGANSKDEPNKGIWDDCTPKTLIAEIITQKDGDGNDAPFIRLLDNDCANDILNYSGRYDQDGTDLAKEGSSDPFYLQNPDGDADKRQTFTAYLKIVTEDECYDLLLKDRYFNAKFLRPINVWGKKGAWIDAKNDVQYIYPVDLLTSKDWRDYTLTLNMDKNFVDGQIGWDYYNIFAITVNYDEIYTDHAAEKSVRDAIEGELTETAKLSKVFGQYKAQMNKASEIPALKKQYLNVAALAQYDYTFDKKTYKTAPQTRIEYTNNGGNVQQFHLFVPVYIQYAWGHNLNHFKGEPNTFKVWTVVTVGKTEGTGASAKKN